MARALIARTNEIAEGELVERLHEGHQILLTRVEGEIYAIDNVCTHVGAPLHEGELGREGRFLVTCPWHDAHFDVRTGKVHQDTTWACDTQAFAVSVEGNDVYVELP